MSNSAVMRSLRRVDITLFLMLGLGGSVAAQPAEGKILQKGKIIYINETESFGNILWKLNHLC